MSAAAPRTDGARADAASSPLRIGMIVPSSNTTMETEIPEMFRRLVGGGAPDVSFHSSRAVLRRVDSESLDQMVGQVDRCTHELADARVDALAYACLVALMARGPGAHAGLEQRMGELTAGIAGYAPVVTSSAGALVRAIAALGLRRVAIVTPYVEALTAQVVAYLEATGVEVTAAVSRGMSDNLAVGRLDPADLRVLVAEMDLSGAEGIVISACVQMPSLPAIPAIEQETGLPVISAATATMWALLRGLGLRTEVRGAGTLLSARVADGFTGLTAVGD
jgi:maleate isomerase